MASAEAVAAVLAAVPAVAAEPVEAGKNDEEKMRKKILINVDIRDRLKE